LAETFARSPACLYRRDIPALIDDLPVILPFAAPRRVEGPIAEVLP
jgi:hypothetical protein